MIRMRIVEAYVGLRQWREARDSARRIGGRVRLRYFWRGVPRGFVWCVEWPA